MGASEARVWASFLFWLGCVLIGIAGSINVYRARYGKEDDRVTDSEHHR